MAGANKLRVHTAIGKVFEDPRPGDQSDKVTQA